MESIQATCHSQEQSKHESTGLIEQSSTFGDFEEEQRNVRASMAKKLGYDPGLARGHSPSAPATIVSLLPSSPPKILPFMPVEEQPDSMCFSQTARNPGQLSETLRTQRYYDHEFCCEHMPGRVVSIGLEALLQVSGGEDMVRKFADLEEKATELREDKALKRLVENGYAEESVVEASEKRTPNLKINGMYWLAALSSRAASEPEPRIYRLDYQAGPDEGFSYDSKYQHDRRYDAMLRPSDSKVSTISNCLVNIEYASADAPDVQYNPCVGTDDGYLKSQQTIVNAHYVLSVQSTRSHVLSLSFHGRAFPNGHVDESDRTSSPVLLQVFMLTSERVDVAIIEDCFGDNIHRLAALLETLRTASIYQLGLCPLVDYSFTSELGEITPKALHLPPSSNTTGSSTATINLFPDRRLSYRRSHPFGRSTLVLAGRIEESQKDVVVKFAQVADTRVGREAEMTGSLFRDAANPPTYAVEAIHSYVSPRRLPELPPGATPSIDGNRGPFRYVSPRAESRVISIVPRHLGIIVFDSTPDAVHSHKASSAVEFVDVLISLFEAILDAFERGVMHGDISSANVLITSDGKLRLIDWEVARWYGAPALDGTVTGTLDTMSISRLRGDPFGLPHDDIESAVYVAVKTLTMSFKPLERDAEAWSTYLGTLKWNDPVVTPADLVGARRSMWAFETEEDPSPKVVELIERADPIRARLFETLLRESIFVSSSNLSTSLKRKYPKASRSPPTKKEVEAHLQSVVEGLVAKMREVKEVASGMKWP
ncbi:Pkinase-fungal domain-containing protein [Pseudohyphozyma bogoriensis]|nr:Pkinase-fungal domain-containing protein [Pseudohyphozyma bogoriensis]